MFIAAGSLALTGSAIDLVVLVGGSALVLGYNLYVVFSGKIHETQQIRRAHKRPPFSFLICNARIEFKRLLCL